MRTPFSTEMLQRAGLFLLVALSLLLLMGANFALAQCFWPGLRPFFPVQHFACDYSPFDVVPLLVALGYWLTGVLSWRERQPASATLFFLACTVILAAGLLSASVIWVTANLFYIALAAFSPLLLHFHLSLLCRPYRALEKYSLVLFSLAGGLLTLPFFVMRIPVYPQVWPFTWLVRMLFIVAVLWTSLLLITGYNSYTSLASRRQIRMLAFSSLFAFAPLVLLSVLPQTLHIEHIDFNATFPGMLSIPIVYSYVAFRARLRLSEKRFRQIWLYYLLFITLLGVYTLVAGLLRSALVQQAWVYTGGISAILLILLFVPLRTLLDRLVMWIFYGNETDYAQAVHYLGERLAGVIEREKLQALLLQELVAAVKPAHAVLFLRQAEGHLQWAGSCGMADTAAFQCALAEQGLLAQFLIQMAQPLESQRVRAAMHSQTLNDAEAHLLHLPNIALWLPLLNEGRIYGLLLFGFRDGDDRFTEEDQRLLSRITNQAGAAIRNVNMAEDLRAGQAELALANQKLILGQEQERRRLAHELHDDTVQQLLGISFRMSSTRKRAVKTLHSDAAAQLLLEDLELVRRDLLDVVSQLRGMIGELRPAGLDELGLRVALEGYVQQLRKNSEPRGGLAAPEVDLKIDEEAPYLSEVQSICLFRIAQEALRNAFQHAQAAQITLRMERSHDHLCLVIADTGRGFHLPDRLSEFTQSNHYGLVGMCERVRAAGGELTITSAPGQGTCLTAVLPIEEKRNG